MWNIVAVVLGLVGLILIVKAVRDQKERGGAQAPKAGGFPECTRDDMSLTDLEAGHADLWDKFFRGEGGRLASRQSLDEEMAVWRNRLESGIDRLFSDEGQEEAHPLTTLDDVNPVIVRVLNQRIRSLKGLETSFMALAALNDPKIRLSELSHIIMGNPLLSGKVLKCANSSYFGLPKEVNSIPTAILVLGMVNLRNIIYREHMLQLVDFDDPRLRKFFNHLWEHLTLTSVCCSHLARAFDSVEPGTLFTMGLLHDIGRFVIATSPLVDRGEDDTLAYDRHFTQEDEVDLFGIHHGLAGKLVAMEWKFPPLVALALEHHHSPGLTDRLALNLDNPSLRHLTALYVADRLASIFSGAAGELVEPLHYSFRSMASRRLLKEVALDPLFLQDIKKAQEMTIRTSRIGG